MLFKDKWRERCEVAMVENLHNLQNEDPLRFATLDQLMGEGRFHDGAVQAAMNPRILQQSQALAHAAFQELPQVGQPVLPYTKITLGPEESYMQFIDRLKEALDLAPQLTPEARVAIGKDLAVQNANKQCKQILASLPAGATMTQMLEACSRIPQMQEEKEKAAIHAQAMAVALKQLSVNGRGDNKGSSKGKAQGCYSCGQQGHLKKRCPMKKGQSGQ